MLQVQEITYNNYAVLLQTELKDFAKAKLMYERAYALNQLSPVLTTNLAIVNVRLGLTDEAERWYRASLISTLISLVYRYPLSALSVAP